MADTPKGLIPRKKGENDAEFMKRIHRIIEERKHKESKPRKTKLDIVSRSEKRRQERPKRKSVRYVEISFSEGFKRVRA